MVHKKTPTEAAYREIFIEWQKLAWADAEKRLNGNLTGEMQRIIMQTMIDGLVNLCVRLLCLGEYPPAELRSNLLQK